MALLVAAADMVKHTGFGSSGKLFAYGMQLCRIQSNWDTLYRVQKFQDRPQGWLNKEDDGETQTRKRTIRRFAMDSLQLLFSRQYDLSYVIQTGNPRHEGFLGEWKESASHVRLVKATDTPRIPLQATGFSMLQMRVGTELGQ